MRSRADWWDKANALAPSLGPAPSLRSVAVELAVAEHETRCGDAWPGENNWGATTVRALHPDERAVIRVAPSVGADHLEVEAAARRDLAAAVAEGRIPDPGPGVALHCDSAPGRGPYFVFFAAFPTPVEGARYFHSFFRTTAEKAALASGDPGATAAAMYAAGYYTGFHVKAADYELRDGRWVQLGEGEVPKGGPVQRGAALNIADYARSLAAIAPGILTALAGWSPGADPPVVTEPATPDLGTTLGVQQALNVTRRDVPGLEPLAEDGIMGRKTRAAVIAFQMQRRLKADGTLGPMTIAALRAALS